jgi:hypothetical protein
MRGRHRAGTVVLMTGLPCRIVLKGDMSERFEAAFGGLSLHREAGYTELAGTLADQSQLRSLLNWVFDLGMQVVSVHTWDECAHPGCWAGPG